MTVTGAVLMEAMRYPGYDAPLSLAEYTALAPSASQALAMAQCNTVDRVSMFWSQIGAESGSLRWREELADGWAYEFRSDLGNIYKGDGPRFKGRCFLQVTGRNNYTKLSEWCFRRGVVPSIDYFVVHPERLSDPKYAWLGAVWYWLGRHPHDGLDYLNQAADANSPLIGTHMVNGGENNLAGRIARYKKIQGMGKIILPSVYHKPIDNKGKDDMAKVVVVDRAECIKRGVKWPGHFLVNGTEVTHIEHVYQLKALQKVWGPEIKLSIQEFRGIGGK